MWWCVKILFLVTIVIHFTSVKNKCTHSYMTMCDHLSDLENEEGVSWWTELIVGNESTSRPLQTYNLHRIIPFRNLNSLTIINQVNRLSSLGGRCDFKNNLQFLTFYKNDIKILESNFFPKINLKKLSLVNNNIEYIEPGVTISGARIEIADLSNNKLEAIENSVFTAYYTGPVVTKVLTIRNNRISHIQTESLPATLEALNLDGNKLRFIQGEALENLKELRQLTLSRNNFYSVPNITNLVKLQYLDFSKNVISAITNTTFVNLSELLFIDLSNNRISTASFSDFSFLAKNRRLLVSVGFNQLYNFAFDNVTGRGFQGVEFFLYGNPFDCKKFDEMQKAMSALKINQNSCDAKFQSEGKTPYCLDYQNIPHQYIEDTRKTFLASIEKNKNLISCGLVPQNFAIFDFTTCVF